MKGLQTPAGSRLHMNDKDGSLHMQDNGGVSMKFDGGGNATTNANTSKIINVGKGSESLLKMDNAGNISLTCNTNITLKTGESSITMKSDGTILISGKIIGIGGSKGVGINGGEAIEINSPKNHIGGETKMDNGDVFIN
jgi:hypothetical protein